VPVEEKKTRTAGETRVLPLPLRSGAAGANMCSGTTVSRSGIEVHLRGPSRSSPVAFPMEARQAAVDANTGPASALSLRLAAQAGPRLRDHACMADFISFRASERGPVCSVLQSPGVDDARSPRKSSRIQFHRLVATLSRRPIGRRRGLRDSAPFFFLFTPARQQGLIGWEEWRELQPAGR
jgi:hypothetical protein